MVKKLGISLTLLAGVVLVGAQMSQGLEIDAADKARVKFRLDVAKQTSKFADCVGKAGSKCVSKTPPETLAVPGATICSAVNPDSSQGISAEDLAAYKEAINKCELKVDFTKKQPEGVSSADAYADPNLGLGSPHDPAECPTIPTDLVTYRQFVIDSAKEKVDDQMAIIPGLCSYDTELGPIKCATKGIGLLLKGAKGLFSCQQKCEGDYSDKKGNGGPTDTFVCCATSGPGIVTNGLNRYADCSPAVAYQACRDKVMGKVDDAATKLGGGPQTIWFSAGKKQLEPEVDNATLELFDVTPDPCL
jgi:hypothetical protein